MVNLEAGFEVVGRSPFGRTIETNPVRGIRSKRLVTQREGSIVWQYDYVSVNQLPNESTNINPVNVWEQRDPIKIHTNDRVTLMIIVGKVRVFTGWNLLCTTPVGLSSRRVVWHLKYSVTRHKQRRVVTSGARTESRLFIHESFIQEVSWSDSYVPENTRPEPSVYERTWYMTTNWPVVSYPGFESYPTVS